MFPCLKENHLEANLGFWISSKVAVKWNVQLDHVFTEFKEV